MAIRVRAVGAPYALGAFRGVGPGLDPGHSCIWLGSLGRGEERERLGRGEEREARQG